MDLQTIVNFALSTISAALGWFAKTIYSAVKDLESDLASHRVEVAKDYAPKADLIRMEAKIDKILDRMSSN